MRNTVVLHFGQVPLVAGRLFFRVKPSGPYRYLQLVENHREGYRTVQRVLFTLTQLLQ